MFHVKAPSQTSDSSTELLNSQLFTETKPFYSQGNEIRPLEHQTSVIRGCVRKQFHLRFTY